MEDADRVGGLSFGQTAQDFVPVSAGSQQDTTTVPSAPASLPADVLANRVSLSLDDKPYLPIAIFSNLIEDGFRVLPFPGAPDKPHKFLIENDETYKRICEAYKSAKQPLRDIGAVQEYHSLYCNTFYLSCCCNRSNC